MYSMHNVLEIVPYDRDWPRDFEAERARIAALFDEVALRIDHVGSTAVPALGAKPIIDIQISVAAVAPIEAYAAVLAQLGYVHGPHPDDAFCPFFHRPAAWPHMHHVHLVEAGGAEERRTLAFRDYLRGHAAVAGEYEQLKRSLAPRFSAADCQTYAEAKSAFIEDVIRRAIAAGYPNRP